jgi:hypothetical protein
MPTNKIHVVPSDIPNIFILPKRRPIEITNAKINNE